MPIEKIILNKCCSLGLIILYDAEAVIYCISIGGGGIVRLDNVQLAVTCFKLIIVQHSSSPSFHQVALARKESKSLDHKLGLGRLAKAMNLTG